MRRSLFVCSTLSKTNGTTVHKGLSQTWNFDTLREFLYPALHTVHITTPTPAKLQDRFKSMAKMKLTAADIDKAHSFVHPHCPLFQLIDSLPVYDSIVTQVNPCTPGYTLNILKSKVGNTLVDYDLLAQALLHSDLINKQQWITLTRETESSAPLCVGDNTIIAAQFHGLPVYSINGGRCVGVDQRTDPLTGNKHTRVVLRSLEHGLLMGEDVFEVKFNAKDQSVILTITSNAKGCALIAPFIPIAVQPSRKKMFFGMVNLARSIVKSPQ